MTVPLIILAVASTLGGFLGLPGSFGRAARGSWSRCSRRPTRSWGSRSRRSRPSTWFSCWCRWWWRCWGWAWPGSSTCGAPLTLPADARRPRSGRSTASCTTSSTWTSSTPPPSCARPWTAPPGCGTTSMSWSSTGRSTASAGCGSAAARSPGPSRPAGCRTTCWASSSGSS